MTCSGSHNLGSLASNLELFSLYYNLVPNSSKARELLSRNSVFVMKDSNVCMWVGQFPTAHRQDQTLNFILKLTSSWTEGVSSEVWSPLSQTGCFSEQVEMREGA